jgi:hypothetical protein
VSAVIVNVADDPVRAACHCSGPAAVTADDHHIAVTPNRLNLG